MDLGISDKWSRCSNRFRNSNQIIIITIKKGTEQKGVFPPYRMSLFNESLCSFDAAEVDVKKNNLHIFFFF